MADLRDEQGNPIQLTDQHGNPVQLTDEYGNPMHLTGVATTHPITITPPMHDVDALKTSAESTPPTFGHGTADQPLHGGAPVATRLAAAGGGGEVHHEKRESSSSSSSSEDDGQGGRRKKKGLREKIKEKLTGGKHKEELGQAPTTGVATTTTGSPITTVTEHHEQHEKKGMLEKIKDKLPGHHTSH